MIESAAIIPLGYGDRVEYSIVAIGNHINDLIRILTDPQVILLEEPGSNIIPGAVRPCKKETKRQAFPPSVTDEKSIDWLMFGPITAVIQHGFIMDEGGCPKYVRSMIDANKLLGVSTKGESLHSEKAIRRMLESSEIAADKIKTKYPDGCVYCEFAVGTRCLHIIYYKSCRQYKELCSPKQGQSCKKDPPYDGEITDITIAIPDTPLPDSSVKLTQHGTIHFDLTKKNPGARAEFVATFLDNPETIVHLVGSKKGYYLSKPKPITRGTPVSVVPPVFVPDAPKIRIEYNRDLFPDVIIESLSVGALDDEETVEPCTVLIVQPCEDDPTEFCVVAVVIKNYEGPDVDAGSIGRRPTTSRPQPVKDFIAMANGEEGSSGPDGQSPVRQVGDRTVPGRS